jgi:hypothetical protein
MQVLECGDQRPWAARLFDCHASFVEPPRNGHPIPPVWIMLLEGHQPMSPVRDDDSAAS